MVSKLRIAIDIDGVLLDIVVNFCDIFNKKHGTSFTRDDVTNWEFFYDWNISEEEAFEIFFEIYENTMSIPFIDDAAPRIMEKLNKKQDVYILSARNSEYRIQIIEKLDFHNIKRGSHYTDLILVKHKPLAAKQNYEFDIYVDDNPHLAEAVKLMEDRYLLLFDQPWNRKPHPFLTVKSWHEIEALIQWNGTGENI